ncbi:Melanoma-associated antigen D2 [Orchesella cincta]|uniref:Melanoma-associated antigen D2 n=1 Tax=Orchesella cincta TaxID=48709 RepID=A0A1D2NCS3_ORCCI|nr:Melanoma-associated antigen D2 [Orchesella cincta]
MAPARKNTRSAGKSTAVGRKRVMAVESDSDNNSGDGHESPEGDFEIMDTEFQDPGTPPSTARQRKKNTRSADLPEYARSQRSRNLKTNSRKKKDADKDEEGGLFYDFETARELSEKEMRDNIMYYVWMQHASTMRPVRKCDLVKLAINKQTKDYPEAIASAEEELENTFGLKLVGFKNGENDSVVGCTVLEASNFIIVSKFRQLATSNVVPVAQIPSGLVKAGLLTILACAYMMDRSLDEDTIWTIFEHLEFTEHICKKKDDLKRFLKTEYVDTMYLTKCEMKDTDEGVIRYGWGFRAEQEFYKYAVLKYVCETISKNPEDFPTHFSKLSRREVALISGQDEFRNASVDDIDVGDSSDEIDVLDDVYDGSRSQATKKSQTSRKQNRNTIEDEDSSETNGEVEDDS